MITLLLCLSLAQDPGALAKVKRVYVDKLTVGEGSEQIRDLLLSAVANLGLFVMTENPERADAFLRGGAEDRIYQETFDFRDGVDGRAQIGTGTVPFERIATMLRGANVCSPTILEIVAENPQLAIEASVEHLDSIRWPTG